MATATPGNPAPFPPIRSGWAPDAETPRPRPGRNHAGHRNIHGVELPQIGGQAIRAIVPAACRAQTEERKCKDFWASER